MATLLENIELTSKSNNQLDKIPKILDDTFPIYQPVSYTHLTLPTILLV